jgi:hypothetical protein
MPARRPRQVWIILALLGVGAMLVLWREHRPAAGMKEPAAARAEPVLPAAKPAAAVASTPTTPPAAVCNGTEISLSERGRTRRICAETVDVDQNGSLRSYRVDLGESPRRWFRIDAIGSRVIAGAVGGEGDHEFQCREKACSGITIGARDVRGARIIDLRDARLLPQFAVGAAVDGGVKLSGQLNTPPEEQLASLACTDQGVTIVTSDSSSNAFCPRGGAGFEMAGDGTKSYRFMNLDGESIRVAVDEGERVRRVEFAGEQTLACGGSSCAGVRISPPGPSGERTFTFAGTTLTETSQADRNAVMSGTLILPPL